MCLLSSVPSHWATHLKDWNICFLLYSLLSPTYCGNSPAALAACGHLHPNLIPATAGLLKNDHYRDWVGLVYYSQSFQQPQRCLWLSLKEQVRGDGTASQKLGGVLLATLGLRQGFLLRPLIAAFNPFTTGLITGWPWQTVEIWEAWCGTWASGLVPSLFSGCSQVLPSLWALLPTTQQGLSWLFVNSSISTLCHFSKSLFFSYPLQSILSE